MRALHRARTSLRSWLRPGLEDRQLAEELQFHLEQQIETNVAAGFPLQEARRLAHLAFGNPTVIREASGDARPGARLRQLLRDFGYGWRLFRRAPGFAIAAVLIVVLGIGTTTAVFGVLYGVVFRPLPYDESHRLVSLWTRLRPLNADRVYVNAADYTDWRRTNDVFEDIALVRHIVNFNLLGDGEPERVFAAGVSPNLLSVLRVTPAIGRPFAPEEAQNGRERVVLLSHSLWARRFGADPNVVGRTIDLSGTPHQVVGVMRPDFEYPGREYALWVPLTINPRELTREEPGYNYLAVARLKRGITVDHARAEMTAIGKRLGDQYPGTNKGVEFELAPLLSDTVAVVRPALLTVFGATACLLLIGGLNLSSLLSARMASRQREFVTRLALGASRGRLLVQSLAEITPTLLVGGGLGLLIAKWAIGLLISLAPVSLPRLETIAVDWHVFAFSLAALTVVGVIAGTLPLWQTRHVEIATAMHEDGRTLSNATAGQSRLVALQIAATLPLIVGAALLSRSSFALASVDPGFRPHHVLSLNLAISRSVHRTDAAIAEFCRTLVERVAGIPGVEAVGMVNRLPLGGVAQTLLFEFEGHDDRAPIMVDSRTVTPDYFRAMGIPLVAGRTFSDVDTQTNPLPSLQNAPVPAIGIIDEQLARAMWPGQQAVGRRFRLPFPNAPWIHIVGVVGHIRHDGLDVDLRTQVYFNYRQRPQDRMALVVRSDQDLRALIAPVLAAVRQVDPQQPVYDVRPMQEVVDASMTQRRVSAALVIGLGVMAFILAAVGLYGSISYGVVRRTREFGIRMALGETQRGIAGSVMRRGAGIALTGATFGFAATVPAALFMQQLLFSVTPFDAASYLLAAGALMAVVITASFLPARRAASVDPSIALRGD